MLEVGNGALSTEESKTHFIQWSMLAAPLIAGNDIRKMTPAIKTILTHSEVIDIDQDPLGRQADRVVSADNVEVWWRPLSGGRAVSCVNLDDNAVKNITVKFSDIDVRSDVQILLMIQLPDDSVAWVRDVWNRKDMGPVQLSFDCVNVPPHGAQVYKLTHRC